MAIERRKARPLTPPVTSDETANVEVDHVESSEVSTSALTKPTTSTMSTSVPINHVPSVSSCVTTISSSEPLITSTSTTIASTSHSAVTTATSLELPLLSTPIFRVPSLLSPSIPTVSTHPGALLTDSVTRTPTLPHTTVPMGHGTKVKLPKLSPKRFNGDITQWSTFWDIFELSIDSNSDLSRIDKFTYIKSLLEGSASEAVSGLKLTGPNYTEAISILKKRFGNKQQIINRHMDNLLNVDAIASQHNSKGLRHLHDTIESQIRGLRSLGVCATSYGSLLSSVLMTKLPQEFRLIVSREVQDEEWNVDRLMKLIEREIDARERASTGNQTQRKFHREPPTAAAMLSSGTMQPKCSYCRQNHPSACCKTVVDVAARKQILRKAGRCFNCLRRNHMSRECRASGRCSTCGGKHHVSICESPTNVPRVPVTPEQTVNRQQGNLMLQPN